MMKKAIAKESVAHLTTEMISETTVRVEDGQVRATDVAYTKLLVARRSGCVRELLQLTL